MDLQTVMLQEAHKAYPSHEEVDQWADRLLKQSEAVAIHAEFVDYCPITVPFGNSPNTLVNKYVKFMASDGRNPFFLQLGNCAMMHPITNLLATCRRRINIELFSKPLFFN